MFEQATAAVLCLRRAVAAFESHCLTGDDAVRLVEIFSEAERLAAAGKGLAARRVDETNAWRHSGHRSAANWLAAKTGSSVGAAVGTLDTAQRLEELPATAQAQRAGRLSEAQAKEIASAAAAQPGAEAELLRVAATEGVGELRERCRAVRAAVAVDEAARQRAIHRSRHLRHWSDTDGAFRMDLRTTPDAGARILAGLRPFCRKAFAEARSAGRRESTEAYAADALVDMAETAATAGDQRSPGPRAMVHVRVDYEALSRGHTQAGETCEIPGVGPIPVTTARAMAADAILKVLLTKGVDVVAVAHGGRSATAHQRSALEERDQTCVVEGCGVRDHLEIDHVDGWALTRTTTLERLARLCRWHHHLKTYCGYRLEGRHGDWRLVPSDTALEDDPVVRPEPPGTSHGTLDFGLARDPPAG